MTIEDVSGEPKGHSTLADSVYANYVVDDKRNGIETLDNFVSLVGRLIRIDSSSDKFADSVTASGLVRQDLAQALRKIESETSKAVGAFHGKHPDALTTELNTSAAALLNETSKTISGLLSDAEKAFEVHYNKCTDEIASRIHDSHSTALSLVQNWLTHDYKHIPTSLLSRISRELNIRANDASNFGSYAVWRDCSCTAQDGSKDRSPSMTVIDVPWKYRFKIDVSELEFWRFVRKASEFGIKELLIPIGTKEPISERIKKAFTFGDKKDAITVRDPVFVKVDDYYATHIRTREKNLFVQLSQGINKDDAQIEITYELSEVDSSSTKTLKSLHIERSRPTITYKPKNAVSTDCTNLLSVGEIIKAFDPGKILLLGDAILDKIQILQEMELMAPQSKLETVHVGSDDHLAVNGSAKKIEFTVLFELLNLIASYFSPVVTRLREERDVRELLLSKENGSAQKNELGAKLNDLKSQLEFSHYYGRTILETLRL